MIDKMKSFRHVL